MFNNSSEENILNKLVEPNTYNLPNTSSIMSTLLIQYAIIDFEQNIHLASQEQMHFINTDLEKSMTLKAPAGSGKTSAILLKAVLEKLKNPSLKIVIIKPTNLACDILSKKLLDTVEHAIVELDLSSIVILTPTQFKESTPKSIDLIICDDTEFYEDTFLLSIKNSSNKRKLIFVENATSPDEYYFTETFRATNKDVFFYEANEHAKVLQIVSSLLLTCQAKDILIVSTPLTRQKLQDDFDEFIESDSVEIDSTQSLINQNFNHILLANYDDTVSLEAKYVLLMDIALIDVKKLEYAYSLCSQSVYIVYDMESENLELLRNNFESNKNT